MNVLLERRILAAIKTAESSGTKNEELVAWCLNVLLGIYYLKEADPESFSLESLTIQFV